MRGSLMSSLFRWRFFDVSGSRVHLGGSSDLGARRTKLKRERSCNPELKIARPSAWYRAYCAASRLWYTSSGKRLPISGTARLPRFDSGGL